MDIKPHLCNNCGEVISPEVSSDLCGACCVTLNQSEVMRCDVKTDDGHRKDVTTDDVTNELMSLFLVLTPDRFSKENKTSNLEGNFDSTHRLEGLKQTAGSEFLNSQRNQDQILKDLGYFHNLHMVPSANEFIHHEAVNMSSYHGSWIVPTRTNSVQIPMVLNNTKPGAVNMSSCHSSGMLSTRTPLVQHPVVPKPHKCDKCDKRFTRRHGLRTHMRLLTSASYVDKHFQINII